jgi:hypothetical protein
MRNVLKFPFFQSVLSVQESNNALSLSRLISKVIPYQHRPGVQISELVLMCPAGNGLTFHLHCCMLSRVFHTSPWHICSLLEEVWSQWRVLQLLSCCKFLSLKYSVCTFYARFMFTLSRARTRVCVCVYSFCCDYTWLPWLIKHKLLSVL